MHRSSLCAVQGQVAEGQGRQGSRSRARVQSRRGQEAAREERRRTLRRTSRDDALPGHLMCAPTRGATTETVTIRRRRSACFKRLVAGAGISGPLDEQTKACPRVARRAPRRPDHRGAAHGCVGSRFRCSCRTTTSMPKAVMRNVASARFAVAQKVWRPRLFDAMSALGLRVALRRR
jgi:hypothetical protein